MSLSQEQRKRYRTIGHDLNPLVTVAEKGLAETVLAEIDRALNDHELIKIKVNVADRDQKNALIQSACEQTGAILIQSIGRVALLLRKAKKPNPKLSNLTRLGN
ncbi:YhbY family RNA-binding protein [Saccharospirillum impatiens]|uniref:YhbY family RNA-binding protein n=1 Tax=Saccharospirillum impatiens TaxID=169438 RepID=UPI00040E3FAD|nr:YhbY family RNA-binding protein [Saccharospirillum impatiens]